MQNKSVFPFCLREKPLPVYHYLKSNACFSMYKKTMDSSSLFVFLSCSLCWLIPITSGQIVIFMVAGIGNIHAGRNSRTHSEVWSGSYNEFFQPEFVRTIPLTSNSSNVNATLSEVETEPPQGSKSQPPWKRLGREFKIETSVVYRKKNALCFCTHPAYPEI